MRPLDPNKQSRILDSALNCYNKLGFEAITIKSISEDSGLSVGAIYTYFETKNDILKAIFDRIRGLLVVEFPIDFDRRLSFAEQFAVIWNNTYDFEDKYFDYFCFATDYVRYNPIPESESRKEFKVVEDFLYLFFETGVAEKQFKELNPLQIVMFMVQSIRWNRQLIKANNPDIPPLSRRQLMLLVWNGIQSV